MKICSCVLSLVLLASMAAPSEAWGPEGHRIVAEIAARHLSPSARSEVARLLEDESMADVSNWADWLRSDPEWSHTAPWHYINIPRGDRYEPLSRTPGSDIVWALQRHAELLSRSDLSRSERGIALKWLVHLVADIHQPLHVGFAGDRGGNTIHVEWFGEKRNLHSIWDSGLIAAWEEPTQIVVDRLSTAPAARVRGAQASQLIDWVDESLVRREVAYRLPDPEDDGDRYVLANRKLVQECLQLAGWRLAGLVNSLVATAGLSAVEPTNAPAGETSEADRQEPGSPSD